MSLKVYVEIPDGRYIGGYVGVVEDSDGQHIIKNSNIEFNLIGGSYVGGILGEAYLGDYDLERMTISGQIVCGGDGCGGVAGSVISSDYFVFNSNIMKNVTITGGNSVGGIVGFANGSDLTLWYDRISNLKVKGEMGIGGLLGYFDCEDKDISIHSFLATNLMVLGTKQVGGVAGNVENCYIDIESSFFDVSVKGMNKIGGLVGELLNCNFNLVESSVVGNVIGEQTPDYVGGLIGLRSALVDNSSIVENLHFGLYNSYQFVQMTVLNKTERQGLIAGGFQKEFNIGSYWYFGDSFVYYYYPQGLLNLIGKESDTNDDAFYWLKPFTIDSTNHFIDSEQNKLNDILSMSECMMHVHQSVNGNAFCYSMPYYTYLNSMYMTNFTPFCIPEDQIATECGSN